MKRTTNTLTTILWLLLGTAVVGLAFWQGQMAVEKEKRLAEALPALPAHTHSVEREALEPVQAVADFEAKAKRGLTDEQILFIIQDFKDAGLASPPDEESLEYEKAQHRWYHRLLKHWLNLSRDQSNEAARSLSELLSKPFSDIASAHPFESSYRYSRIEQVAEYQPWKLCSLTPEQSALTWESWIEHRYPSEAVSTQPSKYDSKIHSETTGAPLFSPPPAKLSVEFDRCAQLIPFLENQEVINSEDPLETPRFTPEDPFESPNSENTTRFRKALHRLHPSQLELMLLMTPKMAEALELLMSEEESTDR